MFALQYFYDSDRPHQAARRRDHCGVVSRYNLSRNLFLSALICRAFQHAILLVDPEDLDDLLKDINSALLKSFK